MQQWLFLLVCVCFWVFQLLIDRVFKATYKDLLVIDYHKPPAIWYNRRMLDRLLRLINYDQGSHSRAITDLALTRVNLGHAAVRVLSICENL